MLTIYINDLELEVEEGSTILEASKKMEISRSTFTRLIKNAHKKIAEFQKCEIILE